MSIEREQNQSWRLPYKPPGAQNPESSQQFPRPASPGFLPPPKRHCPPPEVARDITFSFPTERFLPPKSQHTIWPSLAELMPMGRDPNMVSEMILSLRNHRVNTLAELRRIERVLAAIGTPDVTGPMTSAWLWHVNSHMLLTELRSLTRNYPFSSDCLDEAKRRVLTDPTSNRSWNYCWLVLTKIQTDSLISSYAHYQASLPTMWGGQNPSPEGVAALGNAFVAEWQYAVDQMLRYWERPPVGQAS